MLQKLIDIRGIGDYFFIVPPKSDYNTTGKNELYTIDSEDYVLSGNINIIKALFSDWLQKTFMY